MPVGYLYETHLHTSQSSACGRMTGAEHVRYYKDWGYTGVFVTDHFFRGNCAIPRDLPWREWVKRFGEGFEDAWNEGQRVGLDVFFGWEETFNGDDYLIYGLDRDWLMEHPEVREWTHAQQFEQVRADGGIVIQAHPFRVRDYIPQINLADQFVDGVEVANAGNLPFCDAYAYRYAQRHGFFMTAGSDNHCSRPGLPEEGRVFGLETMTRLDSVDDYVQIVREHAPVGLHFPQSRLMMDEQTPALEAFRIRRDGTTEPCTY